MSVFSEMYPQGPFHSEISYSWEHLLLCVLSYLYYAYDIIGTNQETHRFMRVAGWFVLLYYNMII